MFLRVYSFFIMIKNESFCTQEKVQIIVSRYNRRDDSEILLVERGFKVVEICLYLK